MKYILSVNFTVKVWLNFLGHLIIPNELVVSLDVVVDSVFLVTRVH
jgi:hypothetical protein